jgi:eukaryotic-like serine/threonine-protein kinase
MVLIIQQRVREIFKACLSAKSSHQRDCLLEQGCNGDVLLLQTVLRLLEAHDSNRTFLEEPFCQLDVAGNSRRSNMSECEPDATVKCTTADSVLGSQIGPYKLLEQIGEGGMGVVYVALQQQPIRRMVALKLIKPGMDSKQVIARFEAERQALAIMNHPNIAKVLDAGAMENGSPYFAMELVKGIPITAYCDKHKLDLRQRLELFVKVCEAVQHAHQKGIIHRDLKPSNVLVELDDARAIPKVIDFGIAKAMQQQLTENTVYTGIAQMIGTPMYMSPEQAHLNSMDVDTRSDVYALGVILYELLTGSTPFDRKKLKQVGFDEMRRIIREDEPDRPSLRISTLKNERASTLADRRQIDFRQVSAAIRNELDWIVMRALEKERTRRYSTAVALAEDINRFLRGEIIEACPPSWRYRFGKLARKHRAAIVAISFLFLGILAAVIGTGWQAVRATRAEQNLSQQFVVLQAHEVSRGRTAATSNGSRYFSCTGEGVG